MFLVSAEPSRYQPRDKKMSHLWHRLLPADTTNQFSKIKKRRDAPGERDPLLGLLDEQVVDEVPCRGAGRRRSAVGGEPQRLLDDVAELLRRRRASGHALRLSRRKEAALEPLPSGGCRGGKAHAPPHPSHRHARRSSCHRQARHILAIAAVGWRPGLRVGWSPRSPLPSLAGL
jgi:hypothetical protein